MIAFYPRDFYLVDIFQGYANGGLEEQNTNQYKLKMPFLSSRAILGNLQIQKPVQNLAFFKVLNYSGWLCKWRMFLSWSG